MFLWAAEGRYCRCGRHHPSRLPEIFFCIRIKCSYLGATSNKNINGGFSGLAIGFSLVLIHIVGIKVTGVSVNPARNIGPASFRRR
ncbi:aquaporin [Chryseobacterium sp. SN22]|uniref:aquaporin n=1 Tax=Chryseobacterium sp. SN22 TaxID=2606431 RepID=UPI001E2E2E51|nr:aquaporin [Chryseobacterium sp. SN22]